MSNTKVYLWYLASAVAKGTASVTITPRTHSEPTYVRVSKLDETDLSWDGPHKVWKEALTEALNLPSTVCHGREKGPYERVSQALLEGGTTRQEVLRTARASYLRYVASLPRPLTPDAPYGDGAADEEYKRHSLLYLEEADSLKALPVEALEEDEKTLHNSIVRVLLKGEKVEE